MQEQPARQGRRRAGPRWLPTTTMIRAANRSCRGLVALVVLVAVLLLLQQEAALAFKLPPLGSQRERPTPPPEPEPTPKVLVAGATGRVGRLVVQQLVARGYRVVALAKDPDKAREAFGRPPKDGPLTVVTTGDVTDPAALEAPMRGCVACISCVGPSRISKPTDLLLALAAPFLAPEKVYAKDHPYFVNYRGMQNLVAAVKQAGVPKVIRVSGLSVGYSAFNPVTILLNLVVSFAVRWQLAAEQALRDSGIDYTVIRPGALVDGPATPDDLVVAGDGQGVPVGRISREDVAALCVASLESAKAGHATLSVVSTTAQKPKKGGRGSSSSSKQPPQEAVVEEKDKPVGAATAIVAATKGATAGPSSSSSSSSPPPKSSDALWPYKLLLRREGRPDETPLRTKPHRLAVTAFLLGLSLVAAGAVAALGQAVALLLAKLRPPPANAASSSSPLWRQQPKLSPLQK